MTIMNLKCAVVAACMATAVSVVPASAIEPINPSVTDAVSQTNTKVLGDVPDEAMGSLYQSSGQAVGLAAENAVNAQQNQMVPGAATQGVSTLYGMDPNAQAPASQQAPAEATPSTPRLLELMQAQ